MAGLSGWEFGYTRVEFKIEERQGPMVAADFALALNDSITVGAGGWLNTIGEYSIDGWSDPTDPFAKTDIIHSFRRSLFSVYGSVFYKAVGVQAGIVPVRVTHTVTTRATGATISDDDGGQTDATVFGVVRMRADGDDWMKFAFAGGFGVVRYGARPADAGVGSTPASPSSVAFSMYFNFGWDLYKRLSLDFSYWAISGDEDGGVVGPGNRGGIRSTIGLGYKF